MHDCALNPPLREVRLYGALGRTFGRVHKLAVASAQEAVQALCVLLPGFRAHLVEHSEPGYNVFIGRPGQGNLGPDELARPVGTREAICLVPVVAGAKKAGVFQVILGVALIALTFWNPLGLFAGQFAVFSAAGGVGASMLLGGVLTMLSAPKATRRDERAGAQSYGFDGAVNTDEQGLPVPLNYGRVITGGVRVSAGISTDELALTTASGGLEPLPITIWNPRYPELEPVQT